MPGQQLQHHGELGSLPGGGGEGNTQPLRAVPSGRRTGTRYGALFYSAYRSGLIQRPISSYTPMIVALRPAALDRRSLFTRECPGLFRELDAPFRGSSPRDSAEFFPARRSSIGAGFLELLSRARVEYLSRDARLDLRSTNRHVMTRKRARPSFSRDVRKKGGCV